jgi:hypothetical protein
MVAGYCVGQRSVSVPGWPNAVEQVACFTWNQWPLWLGMGGRLAVESLAGLPRNTQIVWEGNG